MNAALYMHVSNVVLVQLTVSDIALRACVNLSHVAIDLGQVAAILTGTMTDESGSDKS